MKFTIEEHVTFEVEGDTPQEALDAWLQAGEEAKGYAFTGVQERFVYDDKGNPCEVEDS